MQADPDWGTLTVAILAFAIFALAVVIRMITPPLRQPPAPVRPQEYWPIQRPTHTSTEVDGWRRAATVLTDEPDHLPAWVLTQKIVEYTLRDFNNAPPEWLRTKDVDDGYIYILRMESDPPAIKIGFTASPARRIKQLRTGIPHKLTVLALAPGSYELEAMIHRHFAASQLEGEWFEQTPDLLKLASNLKDYLDRHISQEIKQLYPIT